jgi:hypothetical protein
MAAPAWVLLATSLSAAAAASPPPDWLLAKTPAAAFPAALRADSGSGRLTLGNALVEREFTTAPDFACVSFRSLMASPPSEILRAVQPEALLQLDGITYHVGGLVLPAAGAANCSAGRCPDAARRGVFTDKKTLGTMVRNESAFNYVSHSTGKPEPRFEWTPGTRHAPKDVSWPAKGVALAVTFAAPATAATGHRQLEVVIHYELFSGAPVVTKALTVGPKPGVAPSAVAGVVVTGVTVEYLSVTQPYSPLSLYSYAPETRDGPYTGGQHDRGDPHQGEAYNGLLWVEQDSSHGQVVTWQDDAAIGGKGSPAAPGAGEPLLNVSCESRPPWSLSLCALFPPPPPPSTPQPRRARLSA